MGAKRSQSCFSNSNKFRPISYVYIKVKRTIIGFVTPCIDVIDRIIGFVTPCIDVIDRIDALHSINTSSLI